MKWKMIPRVPEWLFSLEPGFFTIPEFKEFTGRQHSTIYMRMIALNVEFKKVRRKGVMHAINEYHWRGAEYYIEKYPQEQHGNSKKTNKKTT